MRKEGYPRHALVCERHTGTGLSLAMIEERNLPVPHRDMRPVSLEEQLICFADKFFSKTKLTKEKPADKIKQSLSKYGNETVEQFEHWCKLFLGNKSIRARLFIIHLHAVTHCKERSNVFDI